MHVPLRIVVRDHLNLRSPALEARIREEAGKLEHFEARIHSCTVTLTEERRRRTGRQFGVHIVVHAPRGAEIVSTHKSGEDVYVAVGNAFDAVRRSLQEEKNVALGEVKRHSLPAAPEAIE